MYKQLLSGVPHSHYTYSYTPYCTLSTQLQSPTRYCKHSYSPKLLIKHTVPPTPSINTVMKVTLHTKNYTQSYTTYCSELHSPTTSCKQIYTSYSTAYTQSHYPITHCSHNFTLPTNCIVYTQLHFPTIHSNHSYTP